MAKRLKNTDPDFDQAFTALLAEKREVSEEVDGVVSGIIRDVRTRGDAALIEISRKFDRIELDEVGIAVSLRDFTNHTRLVVIRRELDARATVGLASVRGRRGPLRKGETPVEPNTHSIKPTPTPTHMNLPLPARRDNQGKGRWKRKGRVRQR